jgi:hypothetical protein
MVPSWVWVWVLYYDRRSIGESVLEQSTHLWHTTRFLLLSDSCVFVDVVLSLSLSDERTGLSFTIAAGPHQRSHFGVRVPWDLWPYFTFSYSRLPFSSPATTRRVTVEVFVLASTRPKRFFRVFVKLRYGTRTKNSPALLRGADDIENTASTIVVCLNVFTKPLPGNASKY